MIYKSLPDPPAIYMLLVSSEFTILQQSREEDCSRGTCPVLVLSSKMHIWISANTHTHSLSLTLTHSLSLLPIPFFTPLSYLPSFLSIFLLFLLHLSLSSSIFSYYTHSPPSTVEIGTSVIQQPPISVSSRAGWYSAGKYVCCCTQFK